MSQPLTLAERIRAVAAIDPEADAIEQTEAWHPWASMTSAIDTFETILRDNGLGPGTEVGMLLRNRPAHIHAMAAVLASSCTVVTMNARQPAESTESELSELAIPVVIADRDDLADPALLSATKNSGTLAIEVDGAHPLSVASALDPDRSFRDGDSAVAVRMLTSGTTGNPKRIAFHARHLKSSVLGSARLTAGSNRKPGVEPDLLLRRGLIVNWAPINHVSGLWRAIEHMTEGRRLGLLETFEPGEWVRVVKTYNARIAMLAPATIRMVLDSDVDKNDLATLRAVTSGTAPLAVALQQEFEETFGIPVLSSYGATEFPGNGAGWTLDDHERFGRAKIGSVGKARPGVSIRVVEETGDPQPANEIGLVEVRAKTAATAPDEDAHWIRTNDLGRLDEDDFLWIVGRADSAIIRGGFKVLATELEEVLERHAGVKEASVVGISDERLGQVPVAAVVAAEPHDAPSTRSLDEHCRSELPSYKVPAEFRIVEDLPRTRSLKVSIPGVRELFSHRGQSSSADRG